MSVTFWGGHRSITHSQNDTDFVTFSVDSFMSWQGRHFPEPHSFSRRGAYSSAPFFREGFDVNYRKVIRLESIKLLLPLLWRQFGLKVTEATDNKIRTLRDLCFGETGRLKGEKAVQWKQMQNLWRRTTTFPAEQRIGEWTLCPSRRFPHPLLFVSVLEAVPCGSRTSGLDIKQTLPKLNFAQINGIFPGEACVSANPWFTFYRISVQLKSMQAPLIMISPPYMT